MAFSSLSSTLIEVGKAIKAEIFTTLKTNQDDLDSRVVAVEASASKVAVFNYPISGLSRFTTLTGVDQEVADRSFTLTSAKVIVFDNLPASGTIEIDVRKGTDSDISSHSTVFTTKPSINLSGASSFDESSNAIFSSAEITQGEYMSLHITSIPAGLNKIQVHIYGEVL